MERMGFSMAMALAAQAILSEALSIKAHAAGGFSILSKNDLYQDAPGSAAILAHEPTNYDRAAGQCKRLGESVWAYDAEGFTSGIGSALAHQVYIGNHADEALFWVASKPSCGCSAITISGDVRKVPCQKKLPVLCSQTASVSAPGSEDTSPRFQITQRVGDLDLTGYRDFFTWKFLGVRFAPEPVRFEYSEPLRGARGNATALAFGAHCLQPPFSEIPSGASDDCLFANIWTPFLPDTNGATKPTLKPVFVFFYGGGFTSGTAANRHTDGTNFASRADVVVVAINYRLGNQGMIVFNDGVHNGNAALSDQVSALHWVAENIAAFGGDPDRVTIGGESAGAMSARYMMTSPLARGLFNQAILRSDGHNGFLHGFGHFLSIEESYEAFTLPLLEQAGCGDAEDAIACMRQLDGYALANLAIGILESPAMWPVVDGAYLTVPQTPLNGTDPGYAQGIRVMSSLTSEEGGVYVGYLPLPWDNIGLEEWASFLGAFGLDPTPVLLDPGFFGIDPAALTGAQLRNATERILSLGSFTCGTKAQMYSASLHGAFETVYGSRFGRTYSVQAFTNQWCDAPGGDPNQSYWRCHGGDQILYWGNVLRVGMVDRDGRDTPFSQLVIDQTASFIWTGDPNPDQEYLALRGFENTLASVQTVDEWKPVDPTNPEWLVLSPGELTMETLRGEEEMCAVLGFPLDYWEA